MNARTKPTVTVTVDGTEVAAHPGELLIDVAARVGVAIPTLCHDPRLDPMGSCRMCLVDVEGQRRLQPACAQRIHDGMVVRTDTERVQRHRQTLLSMYLADTELAHDGLPKERGVGNQVRDLALAHGTGPSLEPLPCARDGRIDLNPYIQFDPESCIACARCVRYCDEVEAVSAITLAGRGFATTIATADQIGLLDSTCEMCGGCIDTCPTGAMTEKPSLQAPPPEQVVRSTCNFCGVGCQLDLHVADDRVVRITSPEPGTTLNDGNLCIKGRFSYEFIHHEERLTTPLIRRNGVMVPATWDEAIQFAAQGLMGVRDRHGADALGFVSSSRCTGEENYLVQKLSRAAFGTNNCHQCAAT
jgi:predicted molibdopterin-dependent oxidoreductase YjgC